MVKATPEHDETRARSNDREENQYWERRSRSSGTLDRWTTSNLNFIKESDLDHKNMKYNWVSEADGRVGYFYSQDYNHVEPKHIKNFEQYAHHFDSDTTKLRKKVGMTANGSGHFQYLMMIPKDWYEETQADKAAIRTAELRGLPVDRNHPSEPHINTAIDAPRRSGTIT